MATNRMALMQISTDLLSEMFRLPKGDLQIVAAVGVAENFGSGMITFLVEGDKLPETDVGKQMPGICPTYYRSGPCEHCGARAVKFQKLGVYARLPPKPFDPGKLLAQLKLDGKDEVT